MQEVVAAYKDTGDVKQVQSTGLHIAGERFIVIKADDRSIYGKKVSLPLFPVDMLWTDRGRVKMGGFILRFEGGNQGNWWDWTCMLTDIESYRARRASSSSRPTWPSSSLTTPRPSSPVPPPTPSSNSPTTSSALVTKLAN